jgi:hypothetical protein
MKYKIKNTQEQAFKLVQDIIKYSPDWGSLRIIVDGNNQDKRTFVNIS